MTETAKRTTAEILDDISRGNLQVAQLHIKEVARLEKFEVTDQGPVLVETITAENGIITSVERPPI